MDDINGRTITEATGSTSSTPRLVVLFRRAPDGAEQFQWGTVGSIPILTLVGHIAVVQAHLVDGGEFPACDNPVPALMLVWDPTTQEMYYSIHPDIPLAPLIGMLETIKFTLVAGRLGQAAAAQQVQLLGPDGRPMRF